MSGRNMRLAPITYENLYTKGKRKLFNARKLTTNKCGPLFGDSLQAMYDGARRDGTNTDIVAVDSKLFKETARVAKLLGKVKSIPPTVVYLDRKWIHIRVSRREFKSWSIKTQRAFMRILSTTNVVYDGQKLKWEWVRVDASDGYMALKAVYSGYGAGRYQPIAP